MKMRGFCLNGHKWMQRLVVGFLIGMVFLMSGCRTLAMISALDGSPLGRETLRGEDFDSIEIPDVFLRELDSAIDWAKNDECLRALQQTSFIQSVRSGEIIGDYGFWRFEQARVTDWTKSAQIRAFVLKNLNAISTLEDYRTFEYFMCDHFRGDHRDEYNRWDKGYEKWDEGYKAWDDGLLSDAQLGSAFKRVMDLVYQEKLKLLQAMDFDKFEKCRFVGNRSEDDLKLIEATLLVDKGIEVFEKVFNYWNEKTDYRERGVLEFQYTHLNRCMREHLNRCMRESLVETLRTSVSAKDKDVRQKSLKAFTAWLKFWNKHSWIDYSHCYSDLYALTLGNAAKAKNKKSFFAWLKFWKKSQPAILKVREDAITGATDSFDKMLCRRNPSKLLDLDLIRLHLNDEYKATAECKQWTLQDFIWGDRVFQRVNLPISLAREVVVAVEANNVDLLKQHLQLKDIVYYTVDGNGRSSRKVAKNALELGIQYGDDTFAKSILGYALQNGSIDVADWLYKNGAKEPPLRAVISDNPSNTVKGVDWLLANEITREESNEGQTKQIPIDAHYCFTIALQRGFVQTADAIQKKYNFKLSGSYSEYLKPYDYEYAVNSCKDPHAVIQYLKTKGLKITDEEFGKVLAYRAKIVTYTNLLDEVRTREEKGLSVADFELLLDAGIDVNGFATKTLELSPWSAQRLEKKADMHRASHLVHFASYLQSLGASESEAAEIEQKLSDQLAEKDEMENELLASGGFGIGWLAMSQAAEDVKTRLARNTLRSTVIKLFEEGKLKTKEYEFIGAETPLLFAVVEAFGDEGLPLVEKMLKKGATLPCVKIEDGKTTDLMDYVRSRDSECRAILLALRQAERAQKK